MQTNNMIEPHPTEPIDQQRQRFIAVAGRLHWLVPIITLLLAAMLIWLGPAERTLGDGIRTVYVHVGLIWTGTAVFFVAAILGLIVLATGSNAWLRWMQVSGWVGTGFYAAGVAMSMVASQDNWGAIFLAEPRMAAALNGVAIALIVQIAIWWLPWMRLRGVLPAALIGLLYWLTSRADLVLHPRDPIGTSNATAIQLTFFGLFMLFSLLAGWLAWRLHRYQVQD